MPEVTVNTYLIGAMFVGGIVAAWKFQYQALMYVIAVAFGVGDLPGFLLTSFLFLVTCLAAGLKRGASS